MPLQRRRIHLIVSVLIALWVGCTARHAQPPLQGQPHGPDDVVRASVRRLYRGEADVGGELPEGRTPQLLLDASVPPSTSSAYPLLAPAQIIAVWLLPQRRAWGDVAGGQWVFLRYQARDARQMPTGRVTVPVTPTLKPLAPPDTSSGAPRARGRPGRISRDDTAPSAMPASEALSRQVQTQLRKLQQSMGMPATPPQAPGTGE
jgi:hypothetical protein